MIIGLTGGIASGKSTVANMMKELGLPIVDADVAARIVVEPGEAAYNQIVEHFGKVVLDKDRRINRARLGDIIFNNEKERHVLNSIVHPEVRKKMIEEKDHYLKNGYDHVVLDIPLLFESKLNSWADRTLVVYTDPDIQLQRLKERNQMTEEEALGRISSQMPLAEKRDLADAIINNNGTLEETKTQLIEILINWLGDHAFLTN